MARRVGVHVFAAFAVLATACSKESPRAAADANAVQETAPAASGAATSASDVHVEGYGVSIALAPPFMANRVPPPMGTVPDQLVFANTGGARVRNMLVMPKAGSTGTVRLVQKGPGWSYVVGEDGTMVALGVDMKNAEGVARIEAGPPDGKWSVRAGDRREAWPEGKKLVSTSSPPGYALTDP